MSRLFRFPLNLFAGAITLVAVFAVWYLVSPLFLDDIVDEALPFEIPSAEELEVMPDPERNAMEAEMMATAAAMSNTGADDPMPRAAGDDDGDEMPTVLAEGEFMGADDFHMGRGMATLYAAGEDRVLRLEDFEATNGPDLHVLLSTHPSPSNRDDLGSDYVDLGSLKGNVGNQNYEISGDVDLEAFRSVVIYCIPFHVVFATAELR